METPILNFPISKTQILPKNKIAASILLFTSIFYPNNLLSQEIQFQSFVKTPYSIVPIAHKSHSYIEQEIPKPIDTILFKGHITYDHNKYIKHQEKNEQPSDTISIGNAKIELITLEGIYTTYSDKQGRFILAIPEYLIQPQNIIKISYRDIKPNSFRKSQFLRFRSENYIISDKALKLPYLIKAQKAIDIVGSIDIIQKPLKTIRYQYFNHSLFSAMNYYTIAQLPIILYNGIEIRYSEYNKKIKGKKGRYNLTNKKVYFFNKQYAQVLFGERAYNGLYYYFD